MDDEVRIDPASKLPYLATRRRGHDLLIDPMSNKGTAFTLPERDALGLHGLLPPAVSSSRRMRAHAARPTTSGGHEEARRSEPGVGEPDGSWSIRAKL